MALIKDGKILRTYEEQVAHLTEEHIKQLEVNKGFDNRIKALEEGGGGGGEPPANMMTTDTEQNVTGAKYFGDPDNSWFVKLPGNNLETDDAEIAIQYGPQSVIIGRNEIKKDGNHTYYYPNSSGTLATIEDVSEHSVKLYRHDITINSSSDSGRYVITVYSTKVSTAITNLYGLRFLLGYNSADFNYCTSCCFYDSFDERHIALVEFSNSNGEPEMYAGFRENEAGLLIYNKIIASISDTVKEI